MNHEFHYRVPQRVGGSRPGAHRGSGLGSGGVFAAHRRLFDHPDPRRLDLRASLRDPHRDWLVRLPAARVAVPVQAVVDVSASMHFGPGRRKLEVAADFVEALGASAYRAGDPVGLVAFDHAVRDDLLLPPRHSRGAGLQMAERLRALPLPQPPQPAAGAAALGQAVAGLSGRAGLVFLVSDFHWPLDGLPAVLEQLAPACVVPLVVWDPAETTPPEERAWVAVRDAESGLRRTLWLRPALRSRWREAVASRREALHSLFTAQGLAPLELAGRFDAEALTRHFLEAVA